MVAAKGVDDTMAKLGVYNEIRRDGGIKREQLRKTEICGRRMDVDD